jgi:hypothetical protein
MGSCEHGYESSVSIKRGEFVAQLYDYKFLKVASVV